MLLPIVDEPDASPSHANPRRVLIVENDPDSLRVLQAGLAQSGFIVTTLKRGEDALTTIDHHRPHLVMLDFEFPGIVTDKLIRQIRRHVPTDRPRLLALSLYSSEQQIVSVFELGVDDYVVRPYSLPVLLARVRAILRRAAPAPSTSQFLDFHRLRMDLQDLRVMVDDQIVALRPMEFRLLELLMRHPERVFTREQVLGRVWAVNSGVDQRAVDVNVQRTRKALARHGCGYYLQTVRSFGYRLSAVSD